MLDDVLCGKKIFIANCNNRMCTLYSTGHSAFNFQCNNISEHVERKDNWSYLVVMV